MPEGAGEAGSERRKRWMEWGKVAPLGCRRMQTASAAARRAAGRLIWQELTLVSTTLIAGELHGSSPFSDALAEALADSRLSCR